MQFESHRCLYPDECHQIVHGHPMNVNTKGKLGTRTIPIIQDLRLLLETYSHPLHPYLFPSCHLNHRWKHMMNAEAASHLVGARTSQRSDRFTFHAFLHWKTLITALATVCFMTIALNRPQSLHLSLPMQYCSKFDRTPLSGRLYTTGRTPTVT